MKKYKQIKDYTMIVGVCRDDSSVIVDITYDGLLEKLDDYDLEDVYKRLVYLKKYVRSILLNRLWQRIKNFFRRS